MLINKWIELLDHALYEMSADAWEDIELRESKWHWFKYAVLKVIFIVLVWLRRQKTEWEMVKIALRKAYRHTFRSSRWSIALFVQYYKAFRS